MLRAVAVDNRGMKNSKETTVNALQKSARVFSVEGDQWDADVVVGKSVRIYGVDANNANGAQWFDLTFNVGDEAVYGSYNLVYTGAIVSITAKTVTIDASGTGENTKRLRLADFLARNRSWTPEKIAAHNAVESRCI